VTRQAVRHLKRADPVLARVIARVGPCRFAPITAGSHFHFIARAIVFQQLAVKAAATIHRRFLELYGAEPPEPHAVAATPDERLRAAGLSRQKLSYIKDLARKVDDGEVRLDRLAVLDDPGVIAELTKVKGIGVWSAQMFLIFRLGRPDVLPVGDLGVQKGIQLAYGLRSLPSPKRVTRIGKPWSPYATIGSWYMWRLLDGPAA
jgi:DNA-3-methyladenine glycosylase II